jgi:hypothetical protein
MGIKFKKSLNDNRIRKITLLVLIKLQLSDVIIF